MKDDESVSLKEYIERILEERDKAIQVALEAQRAKTALIIAIISLIVGFIYFVLRN